MITEKVDKDVPRIVDGEKTIGFALLLTSGKWGAFDVEQNRLTTKKFSSAHEVKKFFEERSIKRPDTVT